MGPSAVWFYEGQLRLHRNERIVRFLVHLLSKSCVLNTKKHEKCKIVTSLKCFYNMTYIFFGCWLWRVVRKTQNSSQGQMSPTTSNFQPLLAFIVVQISTKLHQFQPVVFEIFRRQTHKLTHNTCSQHSWCAGKHYSHLNLIISTFTFWSLS